MFEPNMTQYGPSGTSLWTKNGSKMDITGIYWEIGPRGQKSEKNIFQVRPLKMSGMTSGHRKKWFRAEKVDFDPFGPKTEIRPTGLRRPGMHFWPKNGQKSEKIDFFQNRFKPSNMTPGHQKSMFWAEKCQFSPYRGILGSPLDHFWAIFGPFSDHFWTIFGHFWVTFGPFFGPFLDCFGSLLGHLWITFGPFLDRFGPFSDHFWTILGHFWVSFGPIGTSLGAKNGSKMDKTGICWPILGNRAKGSKK